MLVKLDLLPLYNQNSVRGVGTYTRFLSQELAKLPDLELWSTDDPRKPDLIHYPYFDLFFATLPLKHRQPFVITVHDVIPLKFPKYYPSGVRGKVNFYYQKNILKKAAAVITDSQASKNDIVEFLGIKESKVHVIYLAANPSLTKPSTDQLPAIRRKYHLPTKYILYVGDINYNKNLPQLIKALKYLPKDLHLVLLGKNFRPQEIPEWRWIEAQIAMSSVEKRVHFLTEVKSDDTLALSGIYHLAECYVQPSLYEGFGLPVLEAFACQTPVVCTHNSSLLEVGDESVVYSESTAESMAEKIIEVSAWSKTKRAQMVKHALEWSKKFTWAKTAGETLAVYQQVLA